MALRTFKDYSEPVYQTGTPPKQGYTGGWGATVGGMIGSGIAPGAVKAAGAASIAGTAGTYQAAALGGVAGPAAIALGPWGILGIALGATLVGAGLDWLLGKATSSPGRVAPPPKREPVPVPYAGRTAPRLEHFDYAAMDPGRTQLQVPSVEPVRQTAADSMLAKYGAQTFGQKGPEVGAFGTPRLGSRRA